MEPLLSIVIANYNYGRFLEFAIQSVVSQGVNAQCELIVVDGGSSDESIEIIKKYEQQIAWWCSEKDKGQSDAFNKGFAHARGKYLTWLNADDAFVPGALSYVVEYLLKHPHVEWLSGGIVHCDADMNILDLRIGATPFRSLRRWIYPTSVGNPSTFFLRQRLQEVGGIDEQLHYVMDIDLWMKFFNCGMKLVHINRYLWAFRMHMASKTAIIGAKNAPAPRHVAEENLLKGRFGLCTWKLHVGERFWWLYKLFCGSFAKSFVDSFRLRGRAFDSLI